MSSLRLHRSRFGLGLSLGLGLGFSLLGATGCFEGQRKFFGIDRQPALTIQGPSKDRCQKLPKGTTTRDTCDQQRQAANDYIRKINAGDVVCLENGFGDDPTSECKARAFILDSAKEGYSIEVREAKIESSWYQYSGRTVYFTFGALVDLYLKERGYE
jgi:hypothetical protein